MKLKVLSALVICGLFLQSCQKDDSQPATPTGPKVNFIFKFDSTQARLDGFGNPSAMPANHRGQSPRFNAMSAHYVEMDTSQWLALGAGAVLYRAPEVTTGGATAIDFSQSTFAGNNQVFLSVPLSSLAAGSYKWLRVSLAYQNYNVYMHETTFNTSFDASVASFIGFNTYVSNYKVRDSTITLNSNKLQGYWAVEGVDNILGTNYGFLSQGQAPPGATTVPNPLFASSPIPAGSCVVTGQFASPLIVTGAETSDINIQVSLSTNKSFEWKTVDGNATFDPATGDTVIDMGIRGMIPSKL